MAASSRAVRAKFISGSVSIRRCGSFRNLPSKMAPFGPISRSVPGLAAKPVRAYQLAMADETKIPAERPEAAKPAVPGPDAKPAEHSGPKGPEPTRYGDWEKNGRCIDF
ncbi:MAG: DUF1674 domain-containing protein [Pseudomonadota bacterium]